MRDRLLHAAKERRCHDSDKHQVCSPNDAQRCRVRRCPQAIVNLRPVSWGIAGACRSAEYLCRTSQLQADGGYSQCRSTVDIFYRHSRSGVAASALPRHAAALPVGMQDAAKHSLRPPQRPARPLHPERFRLRRRDAGSAQQRDQPQRPRPHLRAHLLRRRRRLDDRRRSDAPQQGPRAGRQRLDRVRQAAVGCVVPARSICRR